MAKILSAELAGLCSAGSAPSSNSELQTEARYLQTPANTFPAVLPKGKVWANEPPSKEGRSGAIDSLYCKEVQSPPAGTKKLGKQTETAKEGKGESQTEKAAAAGKEAPGEERPQSRDGRRGKTHPTSQDQHLPPFELFTKLSLTDDRLDGIAYLPAGPGSQSSGSLLAAPGAQTLVFDSYTLRPQEHGRGNYSRVYDVFFRSHLDKVATLSTHPVRGRRSMCAFHIENHLHYTDQAVGLLVGLLDAVGATNITLTHWEIQITSPRIIQIPEYIQANRLDRKGGRSWGIEIGEGGTVNGMRIGKQASPRSFNLYKNGTTLERRNRQYIASRVVADGIATMQDKPKLARLELHIKSKEFNKLTYHDSFGELQPVTLQSLLDPSVRLAIFRQEVMSAFIFRKRIGKDRYATAQFFDWEAIERHYARLHGYSAGNHTTAARTPLKARSSDATYGAKQTIKMLSKDGQPGSYLIRGLQKHIERIVRETILANASIRCPTERLSQAGSKSTTNLNGDLEAICYPEGLTELSEELSISLPDIIAHTIAANYGISEYVAKKYRGVV